MASSEYPLKHVRLQQLHDAGLNVADFICFPPQTLKGREGELRAFLQKHKSISCRHFHSNERAHFKCPVLYDQTHFDAVLAFCMANNYGGNDDRTPFYTLCNEAIVLADSVCAGNILTHDEHNWFIEYFYGPGTPRDAEKNVDRLLTYSKTLGSLARGDKPPDEVLKLAYEARKFEALQNKAYILEFSLYPYPIGRNQVNTICWEWRYGWLHYQLQANQYLLEALKHTRTQLQEADVRIAVLEAENEKLKGIEKTEPVDPTSVYENTAWVKHWDHGQEA